MKAYKTLKKALTSGRPEDFDSILMGNAVKLANPQAAYSFDMVGHDSHQLSIAVPPRFSSTWQAGEMVELYWRSLTRDVSYSEFDQNPLTLEAAAELSKLSDFRGPKENGVGGELNKLASNIAHGRDTAGVHWRSDGVEGLKLGESGAIGILQSYQKTYNEKFKGFTFTRFDGTKITI
ncbi:hypothetical protein LIT25_02260 [Bacillus sp. F19]|nr:hypothetical protein LIT25_02260 [Bacillus sp. F19]